MRSIVSEIEIDAPAATVWGILTDFERYREWNPFIPDAEGEVREGARLRVRIEPPGGRGMTFKPEVTRIAEGREFRWLGRLGLRRIFDGEHIFELESLGDTRTRFVQREKFSGLLVPFLWRSLNTNTRRGFEEMNAALKDRAEAASASDTSASDQSASDSSQT